MPLRRTTLVAACAYAAWLLAVPVLPTLAQDVARRPPPALLAVQGAERPIELRRAAVDVDIGAGVADTTIELAFRNSNARTLEGELQFPLAPGQTVVGFALDVGGEMRPAVPVEKARGRQVFEEIARRGVDPGLLEATRGDNFKLRIYPLPPGGERRVRLRIAQRLERSGGDWLYRLPLPYAAGVDDWRAGVRVHGADAAPTVPGALQPVAFRRDGDGVAADVPRAALAGGVLALRGKADGVARAWTGDIDGESYFVADIPVVEGAAWTPRRLPGRVGLLWDSSDSGAARRHDLEFALLDRYFRALGDAEVSLVRLRDRAEAPRSYRVRGGDWSALRRELEATVYDGATALGGWTVDARAGEYLLVSDGLDNYGAAPFPQLAPHQRLFALNGAPGGSDGVRLAALARRHGGRAI
ncbi:VIT domain-containing protein, partial [uncultured Massilia sp.]|uniref:VIT domain-containing protein n=1 Tax=uncultured Massilia sp. TaxID=169973 RepID=UPI0025DB0BB1